MRRVDEIPGCAESIGVRADLMIVSIACALNDEPRKGIDPLTVYLSTNLLRPLT